jgi:hypothetical protein
MRPAEKSETKAGTAESNPATSIDPGVHVDALLRRPGHRQRAVGAADGTGVADNVSVDGKRAPRPQLAGITTRALLVPCGFCWAEPATPCTDVGQHYARFLRMYRRGILDAPGLAAVSKAAPYISAGAIVPNAFDA